MKKHTIVLFAAAMTTAVTLTALAQQDDSRRQLIQKWLRTQQEAIETVQKDAAGLQEILDWGREAIGKWEQRQDLPEEQQAELRAEWEKRREQRGQLLKDLELQIAKLKGSRRFKREHETAMAELKAIRGVAAEERAALTAERLGTLIDQKQQAYEADRAALGFAE